jgi:acyl carrier protein
MNSIKGDSSTVQTIINTLQQVLMIEESIDQHQDLIGLGLDSMASVELVLELETAFDIAFQDDELLLENFSTVERIVSMVESKLN